MLSKRSAQKFGGKSKNKNMKRENGVTGSTMLFPHTKSRLQLGTLSHLAP